MTPGSDISAKDILPSAQNPEERKLNEVSEPADSIGRNGAEGSVPAKKHSVLLRIVTLPVVWLRWLYEWVLSWAHSPFGTAALAVLSFAESSFFPIPPDALQIALSMERPKRSYRYALVSAIASVIGAILGWIIGYALWGWLNPYFVPNIISQANMDKVHAFFETWGFWALFAAAFTPLPFKAFTITAGIMNMGMLPFLAACFVGRSLRFFIVATLFYFFGPTVRGFIDRYFGLLTTLFLILIVAGFYSIKYLL